jgi:hypothetical protein
MYVLHSEIVVIRATICCPNDNNFRTQGVVKKKLLQRVRPPRDIILRRIPHTCRENSRTPLPPLDKGHIVPCVRPAPRTITTAGQGLNLCFGEWRGDGIFLTQSENSFAQGIEPRTWEVLLRCLDHSTKAPFVGVVVS